MKYRPEIDGMRALAIVPVILFHSGFDMFSGGYVGVDIFFVISGYLITTILITDIENKRFSLIYFYERRARRILPALYFVLITATLYGFFTTPFYSRDLFQSIFATTIFSENILLYIESANYFDSDIEKKLLFHTWSLAIEEQFYLIFPILLFLTWRFGKYKVFLIIIILFSISFLLSEVAWHIEPLRKKDITANFFLAPTRMWEILAGSITAFIILKFGIKNNNILSLIGFAAIIYSIFFYDVTTPFPGVYALLPVLGTVLLILFSNKKTIVSKFLSTKIFIGIGVISYSAYLWHQPINVLFDREVSLFVNSSQMTSISLIKIFITVLISILTYFFIEKPFRFKVSKKRFYLTITSITFLLLGISSYGNKSVGFEKFKLSFFDNNKNYYIDYYSELEKKFKSNWGDKTKISNAEILVIGDSMADDFKASLKSQGLDINVLSLGAHCFDKLIKNKPTSESFCPTSLDEIKKTVSLHKHVFIAADFISEDYARNALILRDIFSKISKTYIVNHFRFNYPASDLSYMYLTNRFKERIEHIAYKNLKPKFYEMNNTMSKKANFALVDKYSFFCDDIKKECKLYNSNKEPLFYDELHLTVKGYYIFGLELINFLCKRDNKYCD